MLTLERPSVQEFVNSVMPRASEKSEESFWFLSLNRDNVISAIREILKESTIHVMELYPFIRPRLHLSMSGCCIIHFKRGNCAPEEIDHKIANNMRLFTRLFDKVFVDYVIVTADNRFSFREDGLL